MRWSLAAATLLLVVCLAAHSKASDSVPRIGSEADSNSAVVLQVARQDAAVPLPAASPAAAELPRQDASPRTSANTSTLAIRTNQAPSAVTEVAKARADQPVVRAPSSNEPQLIFKEPIGIRIEYNPFAAGESPSWRFQQGLDRVAREVLYSEPTHTFAPTRLPTDLPPALSSAFCPPAPTLDEQSLLESPFQRDGEIFIDHGVFRAAFQQPLAPLQPLQPVQPPSVAPYQPNIPSAQDTLGMTSIAELAAAVGGSPAQGVSAQQAQAIAPTDIGGLLQSANSVQSVNTTRRSPVALAPTVRGFKFGEIYAQATGAYWFPVREDLDSMLNKIDPGMIQEVVVIPGPYGLRYGPGFSFIDIITQDTPRYQDGSGSDYRANGNVRTNGGQLYGRLTADGGGDDYGYRISYGHRKGSDYEAGNELLIPSGYDSGDVWAQYGFNTGKYQRVEASFLRLDGDNIQYAAQFFDIDRVATNGTTLKAIDEDPSSPWDQFVLEGLVEPHQFHRFDHAG